MTTTRIINTTPDNAAKVQLIVKNDELLHSVVKSLQAQGLFPGLRGMSFTLIGSAEHCEKGLQAVVESL